MALKYTINDPSEVAESLRGDYVKATDGKFRLAIEGDPLAAANAKVAEFRDNNLALQKKLATFEGIDDPVAAKDALAKLATGDDADVVKLKLKLADAESTAAAATQKHDQLVFRSLVSAAFLAVGGRPEAVDYIVGKAPFKLVDGELQPNDAATPTIADWLLEQSAAPASAFVFLPNKGGGSQGANTPTLKLGSGSNVRELVNPTPQELGANAADIKTGRVKVAYTNS